MRVLVSCLCGIVAAVTCGVLLLAITSLRSPEVFGCGLVLAVLAGYCAHGMRPVRRAGVRLRILLRAAASRLGVTAWTLDEAPRVRRFEPRLPRARVDGSAPPPAERAPRGSSTTASRPALASLRAALDRGNPVWISYALITAWAFYEILGVATPGRTPLQIAAASASSVVEGAVAGTTSAIETTSSALCVLGAVAATQDGGAGASTVMGMAAGPDKDLLRSVTDASHAVPAGAGRGPVCEGGTVLEWLMPDPRKAF